MELHTTTRRPPKNVEELQKLHTSLIQYQKFFCELEDLTADFSRIELFQCLLHISVGTAVSFDTQARQGEVPMHQAKVLARQSAMELEPFIRERVAEADLSRYVEICKELRNTLRVKIEDDNDLQMARKSVKDSVEYLDFITKHSRGDPVKLFEFYMVEDGPSLLQLIDASDPTVIVRESNPSLHGATSSPTSMLVQRWNPKVPRPDTECFVEALTQQLQTTIDLKTHASERLVVLQNVLEWVTTIDDFHFSNISEGILLASQVPLSKLCCDKRSSLCRVACDMIVLLSKRVVGILSTDPSPDAKLVYLTVVEKWTNALLGGVYVTTTAISTATDRALRQLVLLNHGDEVIVERLLITLNQKKQAELRKKCIGYLSLCILATEKAKPCSSGSYASMVLPVAETFVEMGDSLSRRMARILCCVLRDVTKAEVAIKNTKVEQLIAKERPLLVSLYDSPDAFNDKILESGSTVSNSTPPPIGLSVDQEKQLYV